MIVAVDVSQTCVERAGCAWLADSHAKLLVEKLGAENVILYHHFGRWINQSAERGTAIDRVAAPFASMEPEEARLLWARIEAGQAELPGRPDIVHSFSFMAPRIPGAKLVYTLHDLCFWSHPELTTESNRLICQQEVLKALEHAAAFAFVSKNSLHDFETVLPGFLDSKGVPAVVTEPCPRQLPADAPSGEVRPADDPAPWLHIGTIEPRKGIIELLDAYEQYHQQSATRRPLLLIGGKGWKSEEIHREIELRARRLPIRYLGYLDDRQLSRHLNQSFGLISLSHYEGFGLPVLEAAARGKPVVCTDPPSFEPYLEAIEFYRKPMPPHQRMIELETKPELCQSIAAQSRQVAQSRKSNWIAASLALYERLMTDK